MSRKAFVPASVMVPPAQAITDETGKQMMDLRTKRLLWDMPVPSSMTRHWNSAGAKRKWFAQYDANDPAGNEARMKAATHQVAAYRGVSCALARTIRATIKYRKTLAERAEAARIKLQLETGVVTQ